MPSPPTRPVSRLELLDQRQYDPRLRLAERMESIPPETVTEERLRAGQTWQALRVGQDELINDRIELEKHDRAMVAARKQIFAAKKEVADLRARVDQIQQERFSPAAVYGLGALAVVSFGAWMFQRRRLLQVDPYGPASVSPVPASPAAFPPAVEPSGISEFDGSDLGVHGDEADQWIERARVAMPAPR